MLPGEVSCIQSGNNAGLYKREIMCKLLFNQVLNGACLIGLSV